MNKVFKKPVDPSGTIDANATISFLQRCTYEKNDKGEQVIAASRVSPLTCIIPLYTKIIGYLDNESKLSLRLTSKDLYQRTVVVSKPFFHYDYEERKIETTISSEWLSHKPFFENVFYKELNIWGFDSFQMCWPRLEKNTNCKDFHSHPTELCQSS